MDRFVGLLIGLRVRVEDVVGQVGWGVLLLDAVQTPGGLGQRLTLRYWELLVELVVSQVPQGPGHQAAVNVMTSLELAGEWDKLVCWMGVAWINWARVGGGPRGDFERMTLALV